jgi:hypothetical protein
LDSPYSNQGVDALGNCNPIFRVGFLELIKQTRDLPIKATVHVERI